MQKLEENLGIYLRPASIPIWLLFKEIRYVDTKWLAHWTTKKTKAVQSKPLEYPWLVLGFIYKDESPSVYF